VRDHDIVTYRPTVSKLGIFCEFVSKEYDTHSHYSGGMLNILSPTMEHFLSLKTPIEAISNATEARVRKKVR
jgi:hypothetical protein